MESIDVVKLILKDYPRISARFREDAEVFDLAFVEAKTKNLVSRSYSTLPGVQGVFQVAPKVVADPISFEDFEQMLIQINSSLGSA